MAYFTPAARAAIVAASPALAGSFDRAPRRTSRPTGYPVRGLMQDSGAPAARTARTNKFAAPCTRCHGHVAEGQGSLEQQDGKWLVFHADGQCPDKTGVTASTPQVQDAAPAAAPQRRTTPNKFGGKCTRCGAWVEAAKGLLGEKIDGRWTVTHDGECPEAAPAPVAKTSAPATAADLRIPLTAESIAALTIGMATVELETGGHLTFKIKVRKADAAWGAGKTEILYLSGPNNEDDYRHLGVIEGSELVLRHPIRSDRMRTALAILMEDRAAAGLGWALESGRCYRCGRTLTVPASLHAGLGPDCASK